ncbi:serine hydrolase domain-containing protein [Oxalobacteraceae bacterium A2-2]
MRAARSLACAVLALGALLGGPPALAAAPADIETAVAQRAEAAGLAGVAAAIILDRKLVWSHGWGLANVERQLPFTPDTVMNIGSISKTVTGVALMQAVEDGKLSLDADINTYLPFRVENPAFPGLPITLRQLATHTSGITDRWEIYRATYHWGGDAPQGLGAFLKDYLVPGGRTYASDNFLPFKPGAHREYSNIASGLAGYIVEQAVGEPLGQYARRRIFQPLGMTRTGWSLAEIPPGTHAALYVGQSGLRIPIPLYGMTTYPDGGVRTSVADLARLFIALLDGGQYGNARILSPATTAEMLRFQYTTGNKPDNVDLAQKNSGIFWSTKYNVTRIGHGGSDPGVRAEMLADLSRDTAVILLTNTSIEGPDSKVYEQILAELWRHAAALRRPAAQH